LTTPEVIVTLLRLGNLLVPGGLPLRLLYEVSIAALSWGLPCAVSAIAQENTTFQHLPLPIPMGMTIATAKGSWFRQKNEGLSASHCRT
jgi:hypothetical protein